VISLRPTLDVAEATPNSGILSAAINRDFERFAQIAHLGVAEPAEPFNEDTDRDALNRVEVRCTLTWHRIVARLKHDFAAEATNRRGARRDQGTAVPRDRRVA